MIIIIILIMITVINKLVIPRVNLLGLKDEGTDARGKGGTGRGTCVLLGTRLVQVCGDLGINQFVYLFIYLPFINLFFICLLTDFVIFFIC